MILGSILDPTYISRFTKENKKSKHFNVRRDRQEVVIPEAKPLFFFEVIKNEERQVHVLYEDATLYIFNKETGLIITLILPNRRLMEKYLRSADEYPSSYPGTQMCAKFHEKYIKKHREITQVQTKEIRKKKRIHMKRNF